MGLAPWRDEGDLAASGLLLPCRWLFEEDDLGGFRDDEAELSTLATEEREAWCPKALEVPGACREDEGFDPSAAAPGRSDFVGIPDFLLEVLSDDGRRSFRAELVGVGMPELIH